MFESMPEPRAEPVAARFTTAKCTHEVYKGEFVFQFNDRLLCPDCFRDEIMWYLDTDYPERMAQLAAWLQIDYKEA